MNILQIERLRAAAKEHYEVVDLLGVLAKSFPCIKNGELGFFGDKADRAYLESAIVAAEFARFDRKKENG